MIAERVDDPIELSDPLAASRTAVMEIRSGIRNERVHLAVLRACTAGAARTARSVAGALNALRLRVDYEDPIVLVDEDSTGATELLPLVFTTRWFEPARSTPTPADDPQSRPSGNSGFQLSSHL